MIKKIPENPIEEDFEEVDTWLSKWLLDQEE